MTKRKYNLKEASQRANTILKQNVQRHERAASINKLREFNLNTISDHSPHAVTIPGAVDAWYQLHKEYCNYRIMNVLQ